MRRMYTAGPPGSFSNMGKLPSAARRGCTLFIPDRRGHGPRVATCVGAMLSPSLRLRDGVKVDFHAGHDSAHFNLRWISSLSGSAKSANLQFLHVYSWPTHTFVSSGKARNFWNAEPSAPACRC